MNYMKGDRVYMLMVHDATGEEKRRMGTVTSDSIEGWDYTDVRFDDWPQFDQPILCYYLYKDESEEENK